MRAYVTQQGEEVGVCALCRDRAEAAGLVPAELAGTRAQSPAARRGPTQALRARLGRAADRAREAAQARREREPEAAEQPATEAGTAPQAGSGEGATGDAPAAQAAHAADAGAGDAAGDRALQRER